ncbi:thioredoxin domain-containing protein [Myxococcota bacterium]|nr:thioredoxin domain-containing protein [Myxococcota bacterium]MBU1537743.1 thioredoxin domain-containing protein [Myxococcota bacterium]
MHTRFILVLSLFLLWSCKDDTVTPGTQAPVQSNPGETKTPASGPVPCDTLFASHGHCFVPKTDKIYNVPRGTSPMKGAKHPLVTIVEFTDFECPACKDFTNNTLASILKQHKDEVGVVFKNYPLSFHKGALKISLAAQEVRTQKGDEAFWKFHDVMFKGNDSGITDEWIRSQAKALDLDMSKFDKAMKSRIHQQAISKDMELGKQVGLEGTPWIFVNGRLARKKSVEDLVTEALAEAKKAVEAGTPREKIYGFITDHGKLFYEKPVEAQTYKLQLEKFKGGFMKNCTKTASDFQSFYGIAYDCSKKITVCAAFIKCIETSIYKK